MIDFINLYFTIFGYHENPIQLLLYGGHVLDIRGLIPLKKVQRSTLVLIKDPKQSFVENIILADRSKINYVLSIDITIIFLP